ncbi:MAG: LytTR family transcriptional regulator [Clostridiales bacterium]|nr:LytTR family transcriptional regulator [Clostridiales bacterium]
MKFRVELCEGAGEPEVVVRCARLDEGVQRLQQFVADQNAAAPGIVFYKENEEYYFPLEDVLFFETGGEKVYAHTERDAYLVRMRLYELEELLPRSFVRISKSAILNVRHVYSIQRNLTASSLIGFQKSHKEVYVSRHYYKVLRQRIDEERGSL